MYFDVNDGELSSEYKLNTRICVDGWTPYYNLKGEYVGYKCRGCDCEYSLQGFTYVESYEDLDW